MYELKKLPNFIVLLLIFFNHLLIGQNELIPLGYQGATKAFIKFKEKSVIYDAFKNKVLKEFDYDIYGNTYLDSILHYSSYVDVDRSKYIYSKYSQEKKFGFLNLSSGKDTGLQFDFTRVYNDSTFVEKDYNWYFLNSDLDYIKISPPLPWERHEKKIKWRFIIFGNMDSFVFNGNLVWSKDTIIIKKHKKEIWLNNINDYHRLTGCKDLLLYHKNKEIFIDTFGNIVPVNTENLSKDYSCCKIFDQHEDLKEKFNCTQQIRNKLNEEIVRSDSISPQYSILKNKAGEILIESNGKLAKTNYKNYIFIKYYNALLVRDDQGWYLMNKKLQKGVKVTNTDHFVQYGKGYLLSKNDDNKYNLYNLIHEKFFFKEDKDSIIYKSGDYLWYKDRSVWYKLTMNHENKVKVQADSILDFNDFFIYYKYQKKYFLTNPNLQIIRLENEENIKLLLNMPFYVNYNTKDRNLSLYFFKNNKILPISNINRIRKLRNGYFLISYNDIILYDNNQDSIKKINNFLDFNKELYKTYDENFDTICYDFKGKKIKCKLDLYERIYKTYQSNLSADSVISSFEEILAKFPDEQVALRQIIYIRITGKLPKHLDLDKLKENINTLYLEYGYRFKDLDLVLKLIDGIQMPSKRKQIIDELEKLKNIEISKNERFFHYKVRQNYKNLINYYIGYLYFLDNNIDESERYKKISTKESNKFLNEIIFNLY